MSISWNIANEFRARLGLEIGNQKHLGGSSGSFSVNLFKFSGMLEVQGLHAHLVNVTTLANMTGVHFDIWDGTTSVDLTLASGSVLSGFGEGSSMIKTGIASEAVAVLNASAISVLEPSTGKRQLQEFSIQARNGVNNYIRINYATTDAPIDVDILCHVEYRHIVNGSIEAV